MAHGGPEHSSLSVTNRHGHRFVLAGAMAHDSPMGFALRIGIRCRENGHVLRRPALIAVEFIGSVQPTGRQTAHDRVIGFARDNLEFMGVDALARVAWAVVTEDLAVSIVDVGALFLVASSPAADPDHEVELVPFGERMIHGVAIDHAAAVFQIAFERLLDLLRPIVPVVFQHDDIVGGKIRVELVHVAALWRTDGHVHFEQARGLQDVFVVRAEGLPAVIVLAREDHRFEWFRSVGAMGGH